MTNKDALKIAEQFGLTNDIIGFSDFESLLLRYTAVIITHATMVTAQQIHAHRFLEQVQAQGLMQ